MKLYEIFLTESLGRGGWLNTKTNKYIDLEFDTRGETHDEFTAANPDIFGEDSTKVFSRGWVRIVYPESAQRGPKVPPWLGIEGAPEFVKTESVRRYASRFIKDWDVDNVDVQLINPSTNRSEGHKTFQMPHELRQLNVFLR